MSHVLDTPREDHVVGAGGDQGGRHLHRGLGGAAAPVEDGRGHLCRIAGLQPGVAGDVAGLLAERRRAADDQVFDDVRREARALQQGGVDGAEHLVGVGVAEPAAFGVRSAHRGAQCLDDQRLAAGVEEGVLRHQMTVPPSTGRTWPVM
nr:hypothetical protein [Streptomyces liliiviolaceus]